MTNRHLRASLACLAYIAMAACSSPQPSTAPSAPVASVRPFASAPPGDRPRVAVVVMENKGYSAVVGSSHAPYTNRLAEMSALATSYYGVSHPSLPNYLALIGGDTFGITSDCTGCHTGERNLVDQFETAHVSWKAYMEGMPHPCFTGAKSGRYAKKHNPFVYFDDVVSNPSRCAKVVPMTELNSDERTGLPEFVWITPNLCNDTHDCGIRTGDDFLSRLVPPLISALGPRGVVFVTYDEGSSDAHGGGHVLTIVAGPGALRGRYSQSFDHYSLLRTIEDRWSLPHLAHAASAAAMRPLLAS